MFNGSKKIPGTHFQDQDRRFTELYKHRDNSIALNKNTESKKSNE
jgi:hypothetical protein